MVQLQLGAQSMKKEEEYKKWFLKNWEWVKTKEYSDLKTDEDFDRWYGRKPGWKTCKHNFVTSSDTSIYAKIYKEIECTKCGLKDRS